MPVRNPITVNSKAFKLALERVVKSPSFRDQLANHPLEALKSIGIQLPKEDIKAIGDRSLADIISKMAWGRGGSAMVSVDTDPQTDPYVDVATEPVVDVATEPAVEVVSDVVVGVAVAVGAENPDAAIKETNRKIDAINKRRR